MTKEKILTDKEVNAILSMAIYWKEVRNRDDTSPLFHETQQIISMLGIRLLSIVEDCAERQKKGEPAT